MVFGMTFPVRGTEPMSESNTGQFIRKDLNFYTYNKRPPFFKRLFGGSEHSPYCEQCGEWLTIHERMIGIPVTDSVLVDPYNSDLVKRLLEKDWSVLQSSERPHDWYMQPLIFLGLARCQHCDGPFVVFGEAHGKASDGIIYFGGIFLMEIEKEAALVLLDTAFDNNLISNKKMEKKAIEFAKGLGSERDYVQLSERKTEAIALGNQGMTYWNNGDLNKAVSSFEEALELFEVMEDEQGLAVTHQQLGTLHYLRGNLDMAEPLLTSALDHYQQRQMQEDLVVCYGILGSISLDRENYAKAETIFGHALRAAKYLGRNDMISKVLESLGDVYSKTERPQRAREAYTESLKLAVESGNSDQAEQVRSKINRLDN
jgi:Tfp pilus assembly protein PilF